ncbi:hypothetical protein pipiens_004394 [Culex pipiens pipiens]|uniref:Secreted protein n=1 Tax=Culex pipiens pipiens TaxID=38569 RepID=A0ABD1CJ85_CULPP
MGRARMSIVLLVVLIACKLGDPARSGSDNSTKPPELTTTIGGRSSFGEVGGDVEQDGVGDQVEGVTTVKGSTTPSAPVASQLDGRSSVAAAAATTDNLNELKQQLRLEGEGGVS